MWPWEHLALGYLAYRGYLAVRRRPAPSEGPVIVLLLATQVPDLVDKPLAWSLGVLPSATSLGHSVFVAGGVVLAAWGLGRRLETPWLGPVVGIGYATHLLGDVLYPVLLGLGFGVGYLLWPVVPQASTPPTSFGARFLDLLGDFLAFLATPRGMAYLLGELVFVGSAVALWFRDGLPGAARIRWLLYGWVRPSRNR